MVRAAACRTREIQSELEGRDHEEDCLQDALARSVRSRSSVAAPARAEDVKAGDLVISQAWSRATPGGAKVAGGYLTIENKGTRRTGCRRSADIAGKTEVHEMAMDNGVMKMRPLDKGLVIDPGKT